MNITIVDFRVLLPVIAIVSIGYLEKEIIEQIFKLEKKSLVDDLLEAIILGTVSLVLPMLIIGLISYKLSITSLMPRFVYFYLSFALLYTVYKTYKIFRYKLPKYALDTKIVVKQTIETVLIFIASLMLCFYFVQVFVYPLRGWDFLHFYLPNAFRIYSTGQISTINELNFLPQFKPPLNVLLYAFGFYVTQSEQIHLIPMLYFVGTLLLTYKIAIQSGLSRKVALISIIFFLATPLTYFLIYEYLYYQEIYIMFFTTASFYYLKKLVPNAKQFTRKSNLNVLLAAASLTGTILSKISGYVLIFVVLFAMPFNRKIKAMMATVIIFLSFHLVRKAVIDIYIGTGIIIALLVFLTVFISFTQQNPQLSLKRFIYILIAYIVPIIVGGYWLWHILSIPIVRRYLENLYVNVSNDKISLKWPGIFIPEANTYLENGHVATFFTSSFSIMFAIMFASTWILLKVVGFIKAYKNHKEFLLWILLFYTFWLSFFAIGSIRYLSPILPAISIITAMGFEEIVSFFNRRDNKKRDGLLALIFTTISGYLFLYPIIPLEVTMEDFHLRWYYAHTHVFSLIGQVLLYNVFIFVLIWKEKKLKFNFESYFNKKITPTKVVALFFTFLLVFVPGGAQIILLTYSNFNISKFQTNYCWFTRESYVELVEAINALGYPDDNILMTINTAGIEYYTSQPTIDLFMLGLAKGASVVESLHLSTKNVTRILNFFTENKVMIFVSLNVSNPWFSAFINEMYWKYPFLQLLFNPLFYKYRFSNEEFILFTLIPREETSYIGPLSVELRGQSEKEKANMMTYDPNSIIINNNASLWVKLDFNNLKSSNRVINVTSTVKYTTDPTTNQTTITRSSFVGQKDYYEAYTEIPIFYLPKETIYLYEVNIEINYYNLFNESVIETYVFYPMEETVNITFINNMWYYGGMHGFSIKKT